MTEIRDDPIIRCLERTGLPPWLLPGGREHCERDADAARGKDDDGKL